MLHYAHCHQIEYHNLNAVSAQQQCSKPVTSQSREGGRGGGGGQALVMLDLVFALHLACVAADAS